MKGTFCEIRRASGCAAVSEWSLRGPCGRGVEKVELPVTGVENLTASGVKLVGHALLCF